MMKNLYSKGLKITIFLGFFALGLV
ncbi:hypothetical protein LCGC14_1280500, partial [marine sediment metagenome]